MRVDRRIWMALGVWFRQPMLWRILVNRVANGEPSLMSSWMCVNSCDTVVHVLWQRRQN